MNIKGINAGEYVVLDSVQTLNYHFVSLRHSQIMEKREEFTQNQQGLVFERQQLVSEYQ